VGSFVQLGLLLLLITGCTTQSTPEVEESDKNSTEKIETKFLSASEEIKNFKENERLKSSVPEMILPSVYQEISVFDDGKITFSAQNTNFSKLLYSLSQTAGLNLIIDRDIDTNIPITMSVKDASIETVLDIMMEISGNYYILKGNILHIKQFMSKSYNIAYIHSATSFGSELGGDTLNSAQAGGSSSNESGGSGGGSQGVKGNFQLKFDNPSKTNDFYGQLESNIQALLSEEGKYTLNKFTGTLSVYDKKHNIDTITTIIDSIKRKANQQVSIEAQILEVTLNDDHSLGIDWTAVKQNVASSGDTLALSQTLGLAGPVAGVLAYSSSNFSAVISALNSNGDVDTVSNPKIKVLSGQSALITSGKLVPFWEKEVQITQGTGGSASTNEVTYNRRDVLDGITMGVTPTIMENGNIMLNIIPVSSKIEKIVTYVDGGLTVASSPIINIKEAGTVIYARDNDLVLIGGLISTTTSELEESIPLLGSIPYLGMFFRNTVHKKEKHELVILLKLNVDQQ